MSMKDELILAIESSCDETAVAVLKNNQELLANVISTQIAVHQKYGGVMPEIASRLHVENISIVIKEALEKANISLDDLQEMSDFLGNNLSKDELREIIMSARGMSKEFDIHTKDVGKISQSQFISAVKKNYH